MSWRRASSPPIRPSAQTACPAGSGFGFFDGRFGFGCLAWRLLGLFRLGLLGDKPSPLADARVATDFAAQVVQAALTYVAVSQDVDLVDARGVDHERSLDSDPVGHAADGEVLAQATSGDTDDRALEHLDALSRAFDDLGVDTHGVARAQRRDLFL